MTAAVRRPLVLTGPPAVGKTTTGRALAEARDRAAYVDVDDLRQLVVSGGQPPWRGAEGAAQALLGASGACALGRGFVEAGFDVVVADVLTPATAAVYRVGLPGALVVHLVVDLVEAQRRAATRPVCITEEEFLGLHARDLAAPPPADVVLDVTGLDEPAQRTAVEEVWVRASSPAG
ncbi:hypothetical protein FHN55_16890 [Streptomyces sp. NP160]|uniref:hypothetical protein n=1 Tax=Streptomyces sp. NP160 TaxID=2586637 RepID=UPI0011194ED7|nr:hypothetical protein [Streptomyces sp. NP160]TNM61509.1 hypothetical protein FHN55_16890 [Streptomyces sp. NP160]